jgi:hypothetical protein
MEAASAPWVRSMGARNASTRISPGVAGLRVVISMGLSSFVGMIATVD